MKFSSILIELYGFSENQGEISHPHMTRDRDACWTRAAVLQIPLYTARRQPALARAAGSSRMRLSELASASPLDALLACGIPADQVDDLLAAAGGDAWVALLTYAQRTQSGPALVFVGSNISSSILHHPHLGRRCPDDPEQFQFCLRAFLFGGTSPVETLCTFRVQSSDSETPERAAVRPHSDPPSPPNPT